MVRKHDSLFRDARLNQVHAGWGVPCPAPGMTLPMVEYDRGEALAFINYMRRDAALPSGPAAAQAYQALSSLRRVDGCEMPAFTALYDNSTWAFKLFPHNESARSFLGTNGWLPCTELHFVRLLYRLRGRKLPDLASYGVNLAEAQWHDGLSFQFPEDWHGQSLSVRRRAYEPEGGGVRFNMRNPCTDVDLAVIGEASRTATLFVDYKQYDAAFDPNHHTYRAMSQIRTGDPGHSLPVPFMIVRYVPDGEGEWKFYALPMNTSAGDLLQNVLVRTNAVAPGWVPDGQEVYLNEERWVAVLEEAVRS